MNDQELGEEDTGLLCRACEEKVKNLGKVWRYSLTSFKLKSNNPKDTGVDFSLEQATSPHHQYQLTGDGPTLRT